MAEVLTTWYDQQTPAARAHLDHYVSLRAARRTREYADGDHRFACWLVTVDLLCRQRHGLSVFDLPGHAWRGDYDAGADPVTALQNGTLT